MAAGDGRDSRRDIPALPFCRVSLRAEHHPAGYPIVLNHLGHHLKKRRLDHGLQLKEVADRLGCHRATVTNWERGRTQPTVAHWPRILRFLGYDPRPQEDGIGDRLRRHRQGRGWSQTDVAKVLGVSESVVWRWESGQRKPRGKYLEMLYALVGDEPRPRPAMVGQRLKRRREQLGFTLRMAAERLGVVQATVCRWERGEREPQGAHLKSVEEFLRDTEADLK